MQPCSKLGAHPAVDDRVVAAVAHGQPVEEHPEDGHEALVVDLRVLVPGQRDDVERQPAEGVKYNNRHHHTYHLQKKDIAAKGVKKNI